MPALLRKRWVWVTALFAVINVLGLWAIVQAIEGRGRRLRVERFLPEGVASTQSIVSVRFDQPMVTRSQIGEPVAEGLLDVFPPVPGGAAWSDTRTATFEPTEELRRATPYTVTVSREFTSLLGHGLGRDHTFEFHTPRLDLLSVRQTGRSRNASLSLSLSFSDRVRPEDLREHLDLRDIADEPLAWSLGGRVPTREVRILTRPYREQWLTATVTKGLQGVSGPLGLLDDRTVRLQVESGLKVTHLSAYARSPEDVAVRVHCTQRVDAEGAAKFIEVEPAVEFQAYSAYGGLRLRGPFGPGKRYRFTFLKGLCGEDGAVLDQKTVRAVTIPDCRPSVCFKTRGLYLSARGQMLLPLETVNVEKVELTLERVYPNNVVHYLRERRGHRRGPDDLSHVVVERTVAVEGPRNQAHVEPLDLRGLLAERSHGLFLARAEDAKHPWTRDQQVLVVTDLGLSAKRSETGLLVWVCGLSASQPVPGAKVAVFTRANQRVLSGTTDARGIAHFSDADLAGDRAPYAVAATRGDDTGIVVLGETGVDISDCDTGGRPYLRQGYEAFLYADRGIYRPGSDIVLHAIVRGPRLAVPEPFPVQFRLTRPDGRHYETLTAKLSKWGTAEVTVPVPRYALTGRYGVELRLPGAEEAIGRHGVRVEEFLPNRMKAEVVAADRRYRAGETLRFTVQAAHLFGSPAAGRAVEVTCRYQPMTFAHPDWAGYRFADGGKDFAAVDSLSRSATLDEQGETTLEVEVPETFACPSSIDVVISATVKEVGGRGVTTHLARHVDPYPRYVGLARASDEHAAIGRTERFRCALVQPDGTPVPQATLTGQVYRVIWHTVLHRNDRGRLRYISESQEEPVGELECAIADGRGTVAFQPEEYGQYILRMRDEEGGASADLRFYCSGRGSVPWAMEKPHRIELTADRKAYAPGDEAVVLVKAPFPGQALFTVESDRVHLARTVAMTGNTTEFRFPVDPAFGPNAYCTATVVRKVEPAEQWSAHRAYGAAPIRLDAEPRHLTVEVEAAEEVRPGMPLRVALRVRDASGAGRPAEVSLAAVDEGICQLTRYRTPDPWDFFYAKRALGVNTSDVYALLMPEMATEAVGSPSATGGDDPEGPTYDPRLFNPVAVERVRQVALWRSGIETDAAGRAEVLLDVPEFTGQLRLMAVASGRSAFGAAERPTLVKQPLMVRASFPRFLAPGDELTVPVTVFNHSAADGAVRLKAEATGGVAFATAEPEAIDVPSDGERTVLLTAHALAVPGPAAMIVTARLGEETAVAEVELPVRPATSLRHEAGSGAVEAGAKARIPIPGGWMKGTDDYALSFSAKPTLKLGESLRYLLRYPYGCIEQTTSSAFPLLYLGDLAETVDPERFDHTAVEGYLQAGIDRVLSMQASNGGFGSWPGYWRVYRWGSVYATHFLVEAKKAGHDVHQDNLGAALDHLEAILSHSDANRATKAYACYVLALAGRPNASWTYRLWEERQEMAAYSRVHIALALSMKQERQIVAGFLDSAKLPPVTKRRDTGGVLHSSTRESAMLLSGFLDLNPEHPHVPVLVQRLDAAMSDGRWLTTQENAFATLALGKYARHLKEQEIDLRARATLDGETLAEFTHEDQVRLQPESLGGRTVEVSTEGQGTLYYYWTAEGIPLADDGRTKDEGLTVRRRLLDREGRELSAGPIPHGAIVVVELTVQADRPVDNVVINDLLPAGFEIENPKLQTSESVQIPGNHEAHPLNPDRVERRDDRLLVFGDIVSTKTLYHRYVVRAVTRGRFRLPAVHAVAMYDPAVCSVHGGGTIELR